MITASCMQLTVNVANKVPAEGDTHSALTCGIVAVGVAAMSEKIVYVVAVTASALHTLAPMLDQVLAAHAWHTDNAVVPANVPAAQNMGVATPVVPIAQNEPSGQYKQMVRPSAG